jgi:3-oxoadipate enol-lactonase
MIVDVTTDDGIKLYARVIGHDDAPPLLLSNSLGTRLEMWDAQVPTLAETFRVIRYDSRGHGRSAVPDRGYTIERLAKDALHVLDALDVQCARFCGLSMGGMVGIWLAAHAHDRVERAVFANTAAQLGPIEMWDARIESVRRGGMAEIATTVIERWFTPAFRASAPESVKSIYDGLLTTSPTGYAGCCTAIRDMDQRSTLGSIRAPILVIGGVHDPATPIVKSHEIADAIPGADLVALDAAHLSNIERRDEFTAAVSDFLTR